MYKSDIPTSIVLLQELHFHSFKKLSKDSYQAILDLGFSETEYHIEFAFSSDLTGEKIKLTYVDINVQEYRKKNKKLLFITQKKPSFNVTLTAKNLDITVMTFNDLVRSFIDTKEYFDSLPKYEKELSNYYPPNVSFRTMKLSFNDYLSGVRSKDRKNIMILEGEIASGKTSFLKHLRLHLTKEYFNDDPKDHRLPILLDATSFTKYKNFEEFILNEGFIKQGITLKTTNIFHILIVLNHFVFLVDNLKLLNDTSPILLLKLIGEMIKYNKEYHSSFIWVVNKDLIFFHYKNKRLLKHFFKPYFYNEEFLFYELEEFSLLDIKHQIKDNQLKSLIGKTPYLRKISNYPYMINIISQLKVSDLIKIHNDDLLFKHLLFSWQAEYLTDMGKEIILENMALSILDDNSFSLKDIPDYMESFINLEFKDQEFNVGRLIKDMNNSPIIEAISGKEYRFSNPYFYFYFIAKRVKEEIEKGYYEHLYYLRYQKVFDLINQSFDYNTLQDIFKKYIFKTEDPFEKGRRFLIYHQVLEYLKKNQEEVIISNTEINDMKIEFNALIGLYLSNVSVKNLELFNCSINYFEGVKVSIDNSDLSFSDYSNFKMDNGEMNHVIAKQSIWNKSSFDAVIIENSQFFQSILTESIFTNTTISHSSLHGIVAVETQFFHSNINKTDISNIDGYKSQFIKSIIEDCKAVSVLLAYAIFEATRLENIDFILSNFEEAQFRSSHLINIQFDSCNLFNVQFTNSEFTNISFRMADLRSTSFEGTKLTNVIFDEADLRDSNILTSNAILCPISKASLERALQGYSLVTTI